MLHRDIPVPLRMLFAKTKKTATVRIVALRMLFAKTKIINRNGPHCCAADVVRDIKNYTPQRFALLRCGCCSRNQKLYTATVRIVALRM